MSDTQQQSTLSVSQFIQNGGSSQPWVGSSPNAIVVTSDSNWTFHVTVSISTVTPNNACMIPLAGIWAPVQAIGSLNGQLGSLFFLGLANVPVTIGPINALPTTGTSGQCIAVLPVSLTDPLGFGPAALGTDWVNPASIKQNQDGSWTVKMSSAITSGPSTVTTIVTINLSMATATP